jgi:hypothetical protein
MVTVRYQIDDFENILSAGFQFELPNDVLDTINKIATQVGASDYVRTPLFPKKTNVSQTAQHSNNKKKIHKNHQITDDDWDAIRNFQATEIKEKVGVDAIIGTIIKNLNKITEKTYNKSFTEICDEINKIVNEDQSVLNKIAETIFNIASTNSMCSSVYAKLFKGLIERYNFINNVFNQHFDKFSDIFTSIEYCSPDENYERFCEINSSNSKRRALSLFYVNLAKQGVISNDRIIAIIKNIQTYFMEMLTRENNKEIIDELSENIYIFITNSNDVLEDHDDWDNIISRIETVAKSKIKDYPSITNKTIFKHMDILDEI